jgi:hypothetical protein
MLACLCSLPHWLQLKIKSVNVDISISDDTGVRAARYLQQQVRGWVVEEGRVDKGEVEGGSVRVRQERIRQGEADRGQLDRKGG